MKKRKRDLSVFIILIFAMILSGCSNKIIDFDYMKDDVKAIVVKNNRDIGLQFTVTDSREIQKIYGILSSSTESSKKNNLTPDYTIDIVKKGGDIVTFNYIIDSTGSGNLFNDSYVYDVPKRLDEEIFSYLDKLKRPKDFTTVYYTTIEKIVEKYRKDNGDNSILTFLINQDKEVQRFIYSKDLENFKSKMSKELNVIEDTTTEGATITFTISTKGFNTVSDTSKSKVQGTFKAKAEIHNEELRIDKTYYIYNEYVDNTWYYSIYDNATDYNNHKSIRN